MRCQHAGLLGAIRLRYAGPPDEKKAVPDARLNCSCGAAVNAVVHTAASISQCAAHIRKTARFLTGDIACKLAPHQYESGCWASHVGRAPLGAAREEFARVLRAGGAYSPPCALRQSWRSWALVREWPLWHGAAMQAAPWSHRAHPGGGHAASEVVVGGSDEGVLTGSAAAPAPAPAPSSAATTARRGPLPGGLGPTGRGGGAGDVVHRPPRALLLGPSFLLRLGLAASPCATRRTACYENLHCA